MFTILFCHILTMFTYLNPQNHQQDASFGLPFTFYKRASYHIYTYLSTAYIMNY